MYEYLNNSILQNSSYELHIGRWEPKIEKLVLYRRLRPVPAILAENRKKTGKPSDFPSKRVPFSLQSINMTGVLQIGDFEGSSTLQTLKKHGIFEGDYSGAP